MSTNLPSTQSAPANTVSALIKLPKYEEAFKRVLGAKAPQFVSSMLALANGKLKECEPRSVVNSCMIAATLDLPIDPNLGFAWIVPYKDKGGVVKAQFQLGYKGVVQLAFRSGQYSRMNARAINEEAFKGWDEIGEPILDWSAIDETKPVFGYVMAWKLVNGFVKCCFWPKERVEVHAKRYSKSYGGKYDSPWKSNFDAMALKTVVKNELMHWGIMSIEMRNAVKYDQGVVNDLGAEPEYPDGTDTPAGDDKFQPADAKVDAPIDVPTQTKPSPSPAPTQEPAGDQDGDLGPQEPPPPPVMEEPPTPTAAEAQAPSPAAPAPEAKPARTGDVAALAEALTTQKITEAVFLEWVGNRIPTLAGLQSLEEMATRSPKKVQQFAPLIGKYADEISAFQAAKK